MNFMRTNERGRRGIALLLSACLALGATLVAWADDAGAILQKTRDTYVGLKSYSDSGTVTNEFGVDGKEQHTFETWFNRAPRHFLLDFRKHGGDRYVIWGDPDAFHTWWKTTGSQTDYPNPNNIPAFSLSTEPTKGSGMKIPTLLYGKSPLAAVMLALHDPELQGIEEIDRHRCHKVVGRASDVYAATGKEVNIHRVTVWIDAESFLVRQVREEYKAPPGSVSRVTTSFQPTANPTLPDVRFKFSPPSS